MASEPSDKVKHLELLQGVINRMAGNSFLLKGWTITLVAGLFALAAGSQNWRFALVAVMPSLAFWWLDAFYLRQERLFRALYDAVRQHEFERAVPDPHLFLMDTSAFKKSVPGLVCTAFSRTLFVLHGTVVVIVAVVAVVLKCHPKGG